MSKGPILAVPSVEPGQGGGHLVRCMALVRELRSLGREAYIFLPGQNEKAEKFVKENFDPAWIVNEINKIFGYIVLDRFQTPPDEFSKWSQIAPLIAIDEGDICRNNSDFLIDVLPGISRIKANIADPSLLPLPKKTPSPATTAKLDNAPFKVLISFGQEDFAGLGLVVARALSAKNFGGSLDITLIAGGMGKNKNEIDDLKNINIVITIPELNKHLGNYDLLITHYGITAFEALYAEVPVLLCAPSAYHEKLAQAAGFFSVGIGKRRAARIAGLLLKKGNPNKTFFWKLKKRSVTLAAQHNLTTSPGQSLATLLEGFTPDVSRNCLVCGTPLQGKVTVWRSFDRTYRACPQCRTISMSRTSPAPIEYTRSYFFEQYEKQYGKTYLADFPNLISMGWRRINIIKKMLRTESAQGLNTVLDIGCAYGPFLAAAKDAGFAPSGIDPAEDAVRYVQDNIKVPAVHGLFPDCTMPDGESSLYDAVTLWYVIEHFRNCIPALEKIRQILKPDGILAFSTPSFTGISGRTSRVRFLENSPADHWTLWSPGSCKKALLNAGFKVKKIVSTGHHPERFPVIGKYARNKNNPLYGILLIISKIFSLGDTFEVYASLTR